VKGVLFLKPAWFAVFAALLFAAACGSDPGSRETPLPSQVPEADGSQTTRPEGGGGVADEIRSLTEKGVPSSLTHSLDLIRARELGNSEFGRVMNAVNSVLL
jgi:hypothetical protein